MVGDRSFLVRGLVHTPLGASLNTCLRPIPFRPRISFNAGLNFEGFTTAWTGQEGLAVKSRLIAHGIKIDEFKYTICAR